MSDLLLTTFKRGETKGDRGRQKETEGDRGMQRECAGVQQRETCRDRVCCSVPWQQELHIICGAAYNMHTVCILYAYLRITVNCI